MKKYEHVAKFLKENQPELFDFKKLMGEYYKSYKKEFDDILQEVLKDSPDLDSALTGVEQFEKYRTADKKLKEYWDKMKIFYGKLFDSDASNSSCELTKEIYELLWDWKAVEDQYYGSINHEIIKGAFGGDTMNSFQTIYRKLKKEGFYRNDLEENDEYNRYVNEYALATHRLGNFVLVPAGFNTARASKTKDYWDASLAILKKEGFKDISKEKFTAYVNYFYLWDFVTEQDGEYVVKLLFDSEADLKDGHALIFLKRVCSYIYKRGIFMTMLLRIKMDRSPEMQKVCEKYFSYIQGVEFLNEVHKDGYKVAMESLFQLLDEEGISPENDTYIELEVAKINFETELFSEKIISFEGEKCAEALRVLQNEGFYEMIDFAVSSGNMSNDIIEELEDWLLSYMDKGISCVLDSVHEMLGI